MSAIPRDDRIRLRHMHPLELRQRFIEKGVPLHLGPVDEADAQAEVDALRAWKRNVG
jgi:hypothetical protein